MGDRMAADIPDVDMAISCRGLTKDYGGGHGLFDLDLDVRRGEVFGFIGANGAGKTTTMRLIMDLIRPDRGTVSVLGLDSRRDSVEVKRRVGYLTGELPQYPGVKAGRVVGLLAGLRGGVDPARIAALSERLQLDLSRRFSDLSHGNKQKVGIVAAFMHEPELLILDEPTLGLDPLMQREVRGLISEAVGSGATCLISSHVLAEIELACDRIGLIRDGHLLRVGTLAELRSMRVHRVEAILPGRCSCLGSRADPGRERCGRRRRARELLGPWLDHAAVCMAGRARGRGARQSRALARGGVPR